jgi:glyoxylate reductase
MISENILELMMPNSYIINSSRSEIIDEKALVRMLQEKKIAGAGLDVFGAEKNLKTELLDLPNTILIPHMGSATVEGRIEMGEKVIVNIKTFIDGHNPPNRII